jgi:primosomal protein DnaI
LRKLRNEMDLSKGDYLEHLKYMIDDDFLIIDDIGSTGLREWREEVLFEIINFRYENMKPTVFTSNFTISEFKKLYHPRVSDRLFATENTIIEITDGKSLRSEGM